MADPRLVTLCVCVALLLFAGFASPRIRLRRTLLSEELGGAPPAFELAIRDGAAEGPERLVVPATHGVLIGRSPSAAIRLSEPMVSRVHARIELRGAGVFVEDLGSRNGTLLNGTPLAREAVLSPGDRVRIGSTEILFVGICEWK
ncbi:MAG: FHA domain-containing protein [Polyangiaceae bacterium]